MLLGKDYFKNGPGPAGCIFFFSCKPKLKHQRNLEAFARAHQSLVFVDPKSLSPILKRSSTISVVHLQSCPRVPGELENVPHCSASRTMWCNVPRKSCLHFFSQMLGKSTAVVWDFRKLIGFYRTKTFKTKGPCRRRHLLDASTGEPRSLVNFWTKKYWTNKKISKKDWTKNMAEYNPNCFLRGFNKQKST